MKKTNKIICAISFAAFFMGSVPFAASIHAETDAYVYGIMDIPYADFYEAELKGSVNEYEVDAVSSATTSKWSKNKEGELFEGTYNKANADSTGTILGVKYPVALTQKTLESLGGNNYNFVKLSEKPAAYKIVSVEGGDVSFSKVQGSDVDAAKEVSATISTSTPWGDYLIKANGLPKDLGAVYGVVLKTKTNESYAMRHLENIWRDELSWSTGFVTSEPHGNILSYKNYVGIMGDTVTEIVYITKNGYYTINTSLYVPVKFKGSISASNADVSSGKTSFALSGFPSDYAKKYSIKDLEASISEGEIKFSNAQPGSYVLTASDLNGVYADMSASFILSTNALPAAYSEQKLVKAEGASDADFKNYIKNISKVSINGKEYKASGKGAVKIINEDGTINFAAAAPDKTNVFDGSGNYSISVSATGYNTPLTFALSAASSQSTSASSESAYETASNPKTGVADTAPKLALLTAALSAAALVLRKKIK